MWAVEEKEQTFMQQFLNYLLMSYDQYLQGMLDPGGDTNYTPWDELQEWLDQGNRIQATYGIDGIRIIVLPKKGDLDGLAHCSHATTQS